MLSFRSPRGTQAASPLHRAWISWFSKGSKVRKAAQVSGAFFSSRRAPKRSEPARMTTSGSGLFISNVEPHAVTPPAKVECQLTFGELGLLAGEKRIVVIELRP